MYTKRQILAAVPALVLVVAAAAPFAASHAGQKITICHLPPGNPGNAHAITVDVHAWPAHEAHGDTMGTCPAVPNPDAEETGGAAPVAGIFTVELCDGRHGERGREIEVSRTGRVTVREKECD